MSTTDPASDDTAAPDPRCGAADVPAREVRALAGSRRPQVAYS